MPENQIPFHVGDKVIHWVYGPGEIIKIEEKVLSGHSSEYYVVQLRDLTIWVPLDGNSDHGLRFPTPVGDFQKLSRILASPAEPLPEDRFLRKSHLLEQLKSQTLESICRLIRDLESYKQTTKLNENDSSILKRAWNSLLSEWSLAFAIPVKQAERELRSFLEMSVI
jgi:RNA polymerase-interacting CarD/CdnL/TRCF family regulator